MFRLIAAVPAALALLAPVRAADHVILVSIDGFAAYHLENDQLELRNIREMIRRGTRAASSETVFPSNTHPSHTTLLTGVEPRLHGVLNNVVRNRETGESFHVTNKPRKEMVLVPTLFDRAKQAGLATASFFWPETKDDPAIDFNVPEVFNDERRAEIAAVPADVLAELRREGVPIDLYFEWYGTPRHGAGDAVLAEAAAHTVKTRKPGLLAIHILITDQAQHDFGPHSPRALAALEQADYAVGILREAVREAGIERETTFIIAADHGFHTVRRQMNVQPAFAKAGLADKISLRGAGWVLAVTLEDGFEAARDQPALDRALAELLASEHVVEVVGPEDFHRRGLPRYEESPYAFGHYLVIPDIDVYLVADPNDPSMEPRPRAVPSHSHGYPPEHPRMRTALVLSGAGVKRGAVIGHVRNLDVAPTIAHLLGLETTGMTGRVLGEALE